MELYFDVLFKENENTLKFGTSTLKLQKMFLSELEKFQWEKESLINELCLIFKNVWDPYSFQKALIHFEDSPLEEVYLIKKRTFRISELMLFVVIYLWKV